ncbi:phosphoglycerate mutase-like [Pyrus ussuriensis x Pyrus communis]|uniref:phosphoglycerate mutase (2,3-diphosphoglycerate-dependent) n=1 Tax=Pyrus ussuriensis x Pyrus communis TaxID=2448454 RepID=A0A5N5GP95_9ROSA|nr:phosphoglycerate mutase-like [Pyrus ussuriensis x Pyrus communis]
MVATAFHRPVGVIQLHGSVGETGSARNCRQKEHCSSRQCRLHVIRSSSSQASTTDPILSTSHGISNNAQKTSSKNLFTGCVDMPLSKKGVDEAIEAGKRISNIPVDMIYTSLLIRAQMTAILAMTQHHRKKVPIVVHNESIQAKTWSQIYSGDTKKQSIPVITAWQLNERITFLFLTYHRFILDLTKFEKIALPAGLNKLETAERYGKEQVHEWRRSFDIPSPSGESLEMCSQRAVAYFERTVPGQKITLQIEPQLQTGKNVLVAAHGNSLKCIISLELSTGVPLLYIFKEGEFMRRGSPVGPTEPGVHAYTKLLIYFKKLNKEAQALACRLHQFDV